MTAVSKMPGHLIRRLHQISTRVFTARVKEAGFDLTPVQFAALDVIRRHPGLDQARLADAVAKDRATRGAVVDRLERKGLVTREREGRAHRYTAVASREDHVAELMRDALDAAPDRGAALARFLGSIPADERASLRDLLD